MRKNGFINYLWSTGGIDPYGRTHGFYGINRPNGVVTIERGGTIKTAHHPGNTQKGGWRDPVRYFREYDKLPVEEELPNIMKISIDRSVDTDAATLEVMLLNTRTRRNTERPDPRTEGAFGQPGYYSPDRGNHPDSRARWGTLQNRWNHLLLPGGIIRTYQGYGGQDLSFGQAVVQGNLMQTGTWMIDDCQFNADGTLTIRCRDMFQLLIDQIMYPPLVPPKMYPLRFFQNDFGAEFTNPDGSTNPWYTDLSDAVRAIAAMAGFFLPNAPGQGKRIPAIFGNIENCGFVPPNEIGADVFDKKPVIDGLNQIKEMVGYIMWNDQEGAFRFESPNFWESGNFLYTGEHVDEVLVCDEKTNLLSYEVLITKKAERSRVIVTTGEPTAGLPGVEWGVWNNPRHLLNNMQVPSMVQVPIDTTKAQMKTMAELIGMHIWFARRQGSATIVGNPCLDVNDQIQIFERTTSEVYTHYVRGVQSEMDLDAGTYTMNLTTHWLGTDNGDWAIHVNPDGYVSINDQQGRADQQNINERFEATESAYRQHHDHPISIHRPGVGL